MGVLWFGTTDFKFNKLKPRKIKLHINHDESELVCLFSKGLLWLNSIEPTQFRFERCIKLVLYKKSNNYPCNIVYRKADVLYLVLYIDESLTTLQKYVSHRLYLESLVLYVSDLVQLFSKNGPSLSFRSCPILIIWVNVDQVNIGSKMSFYYWISCICWVQCIDSVKYIFICFVITVYVLYINVWFIFLGIDTAREVSTHSSYYEYEYWWSQEHYVRNDCHQGKLKDDW